MALIEKQDTIVHRGTTGFFVCPDPTEGHIALVRYSDGHLAAVNVTIQKTLLQLEDRLHCCNSTSYRKTSTNCIFISSSSSGSSNSTTTTTPGSTVLDSIFVFSMNQIWLSINDGNIEQLLLAGQVILDISTLFISFFRLDQSGRVKGLPLCYLDWSCHRWFIWKHSHSLFPRI